MKNRQVLVRGDELLKYIPQRPPIVMIDRLFEANEKFVCTGFLPGTDSLFSSGGFFTEPGILENMAQTAAAGTGYLFIQNKKEVPVGFIGAIKDFQLFKLPGIHEDLTTEVAIVAEVMNASVIRATVSANDGLVATCEMKIFLIDKPAIGAK